MPRPEAEQQRHDGGDADPQGRPCGTGRYQESGGSAHHHRDRSAEQAEGHELARGRPTGLGPHDLAALVA
ncbi:hypothetical protein ACIBL8_23325 [Streptomyces sp. NPDC050523]|uniref:hypothetical protein n=1 Tax=Streptomyces sp. NPDC050523 TaxID=3365622 RepID=UPI0037907754